MDFITNEDIDFWQFLFVGKDILAICDDDVSIRIKLLVLFKSCRKSCDLASAIAIVKQIFVELKYKLLIWN